MQTDIQSATDSGSADEWRVKEDQSGESENDFSFGFGDVRITPALVSFACSCECCVVLLPSIYFFCVIS